MNPIRQEIDKLYKQHFGKMVASLLYTSRDIDPETAEDIVQDSFSSALTDWKEKGIPANPMGWIYKVCRNNALNKIKKDRRLEGLTDKTDPGSVEPRFSESVLGDQQLQLLFACAHPDLSPKAQVVITLKYVVNLRVEVIAQLLGMTLDGVDKLLLRARQKIKDEKIILEEPHPRALKERLSIVHKIIYLTFNEGYKSSGGKEILKEELCEEALILNKSLLDSGFGNKETQALHALMLYNGARFKSRFSPSGDLVDLENQDRSLWNQDLILLAHHFLTQSQSEAISSYHLEAAIASLHCRATQFASTDWATIAKLYRRLMHLQANPFVELNYAIALFYAGDRQAAFQLLDGLQRHAFFSHYYLLNMTLGKFHYLEGDHDLARSFLLRAWQQTKSGQEKNFIQHMIAKLEEPNNLFQ